MTVTDIKFRKLFDSEPLKAVCSITIDNAIAVHDVKLITAKGKILVVMPSKRRPDGEYSDIVHPINSAARTEIEKAVLTEYNKLIESKNAEIRE